MFEQSILTQAATNKKWSVFVSLSGQVVFVGVMILVPLIFNERIGQLRVSPMALTAPPPVHPRPPVSQATSRAHAVSPTAQTVFVAPSRVPDRVASVHDALPEVEVPGGVPGGTGALTTMTGVIGDLIKNIALPPPPARAQQAPAAAPAAPKVIRVNVGVQEAKLIRRVVPAYPVLARQARVSGTVRLTAMISKDGTIRSLELLSGSPLLSPAAIEAVRQWVYKPTLLNNEPVEVITTIDVVFTLSQ